MSHRHLYFLNTWVAGLMALVGGVTLLLQPAEGSRFEVLSEVIPILKEHFVDVPFLLFFSVPQQTRCNCLDQQQMQ